MPETAHPPRRALRGERGRGSDGKVTFVALLAAWRFNEQKTAISGSSQRQMAAAAALRPAAVTVPDPVTDMVTDTPTAHTPGHDPPSTRSARSGQAHTPTGTTPVTVPAAVPPTSTATPTCGSIPKALVLAPRRPISSCTVETATISLGGLETVCQIRTVHKE